MCGIVGWVNFEECIKDKKYMVESMTETLAKRGPDAAGIYEKENILFGHRRLAIVDLEGGKQPMTRKMGKFEYTLIYNGELYNTEDLRKILVEKGYSFEGYSDTEVLLVSYMEFKEDCVEYLNGIYAFAIYDEYKNQIFIARDRLGVKPLFYTVKGNNFIFASELKAILAHDMIEPVLGKRGIFEIFGLGPSRSQGCGVFENINEVLPGEYMVYNQNGVYKKTYWEVENREHTDNLETTVQMVRELVVDAIKRQLVSDRPICTFLSGGLDSSIISAVAANHIRENGLEKLKTFSIDYAGNDKYFKPNLYQPNSDSDYINIMVNDIGAQHHPIIISQEDLFEALHESVLACDLPGMADIDSSLFLFCKEIRKEAVVALSGECADEIFGGYPWFTNESKGEIFPWIKKLDERVEIMSPRFNNIGLTEYVRARYEDTMRRMPLILENDPELERKKMFYINRLWFMQTLLNRKDRMSMRNSLEVRVPFADHRLVEYVWNIPWEMKYLNGQEKGLLREAVKGLLPEEVRLRKKSPYPKTHNPLYTNIVKVWMRQILDDRSSPLLELIDKEKVKNMVDNIDDYGNTPFFGQLMTGPQTLAYLIQVNMWMEEYGVKLKV
ncbi:MAG TPA: asparagine synthase (glutamine-hydrolyzing) [Clostridiales bacterium]|nr:MAG: asparagine synthase (glutamine-hydrolyzing) [Clostridiales bacterium GWD2_32_59]HAN09978.1 asparagine synthase (glutamine-hydrolyzing) [Clostridiales bacterium]